MISTEIKSLSWKYYIPLYLIFISLLLFATRDFESAKSSPITLSNLHRIISILLEIFVVIFYFIYRGKIRKFSLLLGLYGIYIFIGLVSAFVYSNQIFYDIWKVLELFSLLLLGIYILSVSRNNIKIVWSFFDKIIIFIKLLLLSVVFSMIIDPGNAFMPMMHAEGALFPFRLQGTLIIINALSVGTLAAFLLYYYLVKVIYTKNYALLNMNSFWIFISFVLLILSQSRTSIFGLLIALTIYLLLILKISIIKRFFLILVSSSFVIAIFPSFMKAIQRGDSSEVIGSLSGRATWWKFAWHKYLNGDVLEQLIGFGFASGERKIANEASNGFMNTLDSTYLSSLISTGTIGTFFLIITLLLLNFIFFKQAKKEKRSYKYAQVFGISIILFVKTFTTGTINVLTYYTLIFIVLIILVPKKYRRLS